MKKIKAVIYATSSLLMTAPFLALATEDDTTPTVGNPEKFSLESHSYNLPGGTITGIITGILSFLLMAVGIIGVMGFAIAGILYLTAAGDDDRIKKAKSAMTYSIIGVIVALAGYVALQAAQGVLGGSSSF